MNSRIVTYSPAYTIVPTYECFNRCSYCNFRANPGETPWLSLASARQKLESLQPFKVTEILILSGEVHPNSAKREAWFKHIYQLCELALSLGFLPHTNVGPLTFREMEQLKQVNVSMGLMLEQLTSLLLQTVHKYAPSKIPSLRLQQLKWAGELQIPFTTGILLGLGETPQDCWESLEAIALIHKRWGNIQEVIIQPHSLGQQQTYSGSSFTLADLPKIIALARQMLPKTIRIQIPPNLVTQPEILLECLEMGARDLGGIGPIDEVNPDYPHPTYESLVKILKPAGWELTTRLPVYPQYYDWVPKQLQKALPLPPLNNLTPNPRRVRFLRTT